VTYRQKTVLQAIGCTALSLVIALGLKATGMIQDETKFLAAFALYLAWLARIRQTKV